MCKARLVMGTYILIFDGRLFLCKGFSGVWGQGFSRGFTPRSRGDAPYLKLPYLV